MTPKPVATSRRIDIVLARSRPMGDSTLDGTDGLAKFSSRRTGDGYLGQSATL